MTRSRLSTDWTSLDWNLLQGPVEQYLSGLESHVRLALREILEQVCRCASFVIAEY